MSSQWIHILQGNIFLLVLWRQVILDLMFLTFSLISFSHRKIKSKVPFFFLTPFSRNLQKFIYVDSGRGSDQISPDRPIRSVLGRANPIPPASQFLVWICKIGQGYPSISLDWIGIGQSNRPGSGWDQLIWSWFPILHWFGHAIHAIYDTFSSLSFLLYTLPACNSSESLQTTCRHLS